MKNKGLINTLIITSYILFSISLFAPAVQLSLEFNKGTAIGRVDNVLIGWSAFLHSVVAFINNVMVGFLAIIFGHWDELCSQTFWFSSYYGFLGVGNFILIAAPIMSFSGRIKMAPILVSFLAIMSIFGPFIFSTDFEQIRMGYWLWCFSLAIMSIGLWSNRFV